MEVMLASAVLMLVLFGVSSVLATQLVSVGSSSRQVVADGLLNKAMEEVRAVPYTIVEEGLSPTDVCGDSQITAAGCPNPTSATYGGESVPFVDTTYSQAPFTPKHQATEIVNGTSYTVSAYPTVYAGSPSASGIMRVTVVVSWRSDGLPDVKTVSAQTLVYPGTCYVNGVCPFPGVSQSFFYANASAGTANAFSLTGVLSGTTFTQLQALLAQVSSSMQVEQVSKVLGSLTTSGVEADGTSTGTQTLGATSVSSEADNDPGTSNASWQTSTVNQSSGSLGMGLGVGSDSGATTSTVAASSSPPQGASYCYHDYTLSAYEKTGLPCGSTYLTGSALSVDLPLVDSLGTVPLAQVASENVSSFVSRYTAAGTSSTYCDTGGATYGDGCVHADVQRTFGSVEFGGLPSLLGTEPVGWGGNGGSCPNGNYLVGLFGYTESASSESGVDAAAPTASASAGTLCYYTGNVLNPYSSVSLSNLVEQGATPLTISPSATVNIGVLGVGISVSVSASLTTGTVTDVPNTVTDCSAALCQASSSISSPISGSVGLDVTVAGVTIANVTLQVDMGSITAATSYRAVPSQ
jgi:hypothetical protein